MDTEHELPSREDVLFITIPQHLPERQLDQITAVLKRELPHHRIVCLTEGIGVTAVPRGTPPPIGYADHPRYTAEESLALLSIAEAANRACTIARVFRRKPDETPLSRGERVMLAAKTMQDVVEEGAADRRAYLADRVTRRLSRAKPGLLRAAEAIPDDFGGWWSDRAFDPLAESDVASYPVQWPDWLPELPEMMTPMYRMALDLHDASKSAARTHVRAPVMQHLDWLRRIPWPDLTSDDAERCDSCRIVTRWTGTGWVGWGGSGEAR